MTLLPIGGSAPMLAALENKRVDAFALSSPTSDEAVSRLGAFLLYDGSSGEWEPLNGAPYMALIGNTDWLHNNQKTAVGVYRALARGLTFLRELPAEARTAIRKRLHQFNDAAFQAGYDTTLHGFPATPAIDMATVTSFIETVDRKTLDVPAAKMVSMQITELASKK
jgi:NitT/TauT family transport system substrate-binding protein